jgi:hypothetical protein
VDEMNVCPKLATEMGNSEEVKGDLKNMKKSIIQLSQVLVYWS